MANLTDWTDGSITSPLYLVSPPALAMGVPLDHLLECLDRALLALPGKGSDRRRRLRAAQAVRDLLAELSMLDRPLGERFQRVTGQPFADWLEGHDEPIVDALGLLAKAEAPSDALVGPRVRPLVRALTPSPH